jgi:predicted DCC family thiol-disulfide oxidoreductase YuxK
MDEAKERAPSADEAPLLLYDGTCGLCDAAVGFVLARDRRRVFRFAALQSEAATRALEPFGGRPADLTTFYLIAGPPGRRVLRSRSDAALEVARLLGGPWQAAAVLRAMPRAWLDRGYDLMARHRQRLLGPAAECRVLRAEDRARFLDADERRLP